MMEFIKFRNIWHIRFYDENGIRRMRSLKAQAKEGQSEPDNFIKARATRLFASVVKSDKKPKPADVAFGATVNSVVASYENHLRALQESRLRRGSSTRKENDMVYQLRHWKAIGAMRLFEVDAETLAAHERGRMRTGLKDSAMNREKQILRAALNRATLSKGDREQADRIIRLMRFESEERFERNRNPQTDELKNLVKGSKMHAAIALLLEAIAGCRRGEVLRAKWSDIDWKMRALFLGITKNGSKRWAPLAIKHQDGTVDMELLKILSVYRTAQRAKGQDCEYIVSWRGKKIGTYRAAFDKAREEAGIEDIRPHDFRHMANTRLERLGFGQNVRMQAMGHKTTEANNRYFDGATIAEITGVKEPEVPGTVTVEEFIAWFGLQEFVQAGAFIGDASPNIGIHSGIREQNKRGRIAASL